MKRYSVIIILGILALSIGLSFRPKKPVPQSAATIFPEPSAEKAKVQEESRAVETNAVPTVAETNLSQRVSVPYNFHPVLSDK